MLTWAQALAFGVDELGGSDNITDVLRLLTDKTKYNLLAVYEMADEEYPNVEEFKEFVARRKLGEPVAYITQRQDFWNNSFYVNNNVLIPRQDSELIIETLLGLPTPGTILELGVGSGAIIISYLLEARGVQGFASDLSPLALDVAKLNCQRHDCAINFRLGSWFEPWNGDKFDIIIANPPYIAASDSCLELLQYEPRLALVADESGLSELITIISVAQNYLNSGGWLLLEHGYDQAGILSEYLQGWHSVVCLQDLNGCDRLILAQAH